MSQTLAAVIMQAELGMARKMAFMQQLQTLCLLGESLCALVLQLLLEFFIKVKQLMHTLIKKIFKNQRLVKLFFLFTIFSIKNIFSVFCYFIPPKDWQIGQSQNPDSKVEIIFVGNNRKGIAPSINLTTEKVNISLHQYIQCVKKIHTADPNTKWRDLGDHKSSMGVGRLVEIEMKLPQGPFKVLQFLSLKDNTVYILTMGILKSEFTQYVPEFEKILQTLCLTCDLTDKVDPMKKTTLTKLIDDLHKDLKSAQQYKLSSEEAFQTTSFQEKAWLPFQSKIIEDFSEMGPYWQILLLKDIQAQILQKT